MAEKYGVIPKRFTKAWWEYFWMYYKWYVIIAVIVLALVISTVHQVVTAPKYDITLVYAGGTVYDQAAEDALNKKLSENVRDVNENGETLAQLLQYNFAIDSKEVEYAMAMDVKLQMALSEDETFIFIMDKELLERYIGSSAENCVFAPLDNWLTTDVAEEKKYMAHGKAYAVELSGNKFLEDCGINAEGKYLCMRFYPRPNQKKFIPGYEAAAELGSLMLNGGGM